MGKFDGVLLVSDFDGTFFHHGTHQIPPRNLTAVQHFIAQGGFFAVATGRALTTFAPNVAGLPINAPCICSNGAVLYDFSTHQLLLHNHLPANTTQDLLALAQAFPSVAIEVYHQNDIYAYRPNAITDSHMELVHAKYIPCDLADIPAPSTKVLVQQKHELLEEVQAWVLAHFPQQYEVIFSSEYFLEITAKGCHKGGAVLKLAEHLGVNPAHIYCAGDNENDIPMLTVAAQGFAPTDCTQGVASCGAALLCPCEEGLIADIIQLLDQRY